jgi:hypothetical protein
MSEVKCDYYSSVTEKSIEWLWYPYIPYGKLTLLQGDPGEGKSTFILNMVALLTKGLPMPDGSMTKTAQTVIYQCAEDNSADTIKPRLIQAGADCSKVAFIEEGEKSLTLDDPRLEEALILTGARLLVLDPLQAYMGQDSDMQSAARMRTVMGKLASLADKYQCAVVLIGHMNKSSKGKQLYRGLGSIDIVALARSVLMIEHDRDNPDIRYMFSIKSSLAPQGDAIGFTFVEKQGFRWLGRCKRNVEDEGKAQKSYVTKKQRAREYLEVMLSAGDETSTSVYEKMKSLGICERTVRWAQQELGIKAYRKGNAWYWHMEKGNGV